MIKVNIGLFGILAILLIVTILSFFLIDEINYIKTNLDLILNIIEDIDSDLHESKSLI